MDKDFAIIYLCPFLPTTTVSAMFGEVFVVLIT